MTGLTGMVGFGVPMTEKTSAKSRHAGVELIATLALAVSLLVAATAVSIGMVRARTFHSIDFERCAPFSVAAFLHTHLGDKML
jgi:hypothetical protein